jgi:DHA2 family multidrug resistance protein
MPPGIDGNWQPKHNRWAIALTVTLATFMEVLDTSIANVALPAHRRRPRRFSQDEATWVLTSYLVATAVILPMSAGWLVQPLIGRKRFYMILRRACSPSCSHPLRTRALTLPAPHPRPRPARPRAAAASQPSEQAILADTFPHRNSAARPSPSTAWPSSSPPPSAPPSGAGSPTTTTGAGSSSSTSPSRSCSARPHLSNRIVEDPPHLNARKDARHRQSGLNLDYTGLGLLAIGVGLPPVRPRQGPGETTGSARTSSPSSSRPVSEPCSRS